MLSTGIFAILCVLFALICTFAAGTEVYETAAPAFSLAETHSKAAVKEEGGEFTPCKTCVFVLERIKKGTNMLLPAICSEVYTKYPDSYGTVRRVTFAYVD